MGSSFAGWRLVFPNFDALTRGKILELLAVDGWRLTVDGWQLLNGNLVQEFQKIITSVLINI